MLIEVHTGGKTVVTFEDMEEHSAVISGLDSDRNHPARNKLYRGLQRARADHHRRTMDLYGFSNVVDEINANLLADLVQALDDLGVGPTSHPAIEAAAAAVTANKRQR